MGLPCGRCTLSDVHYVCGITRTPWMYRTCKSTKIHQCEVDISLKFCAAGWDMHFYRVQQCRMPMCGIHIPVYTGCPEKCPRL
jgi:hypothetical protein